MPTASSVIADIIECAKAKGNIKTVYWENGAQSVFSGADSYPERYFIRTDFDASAVISGSEKVSENTYITAPLTETEVFMLTEKINEHGKLLSKIPVFE